MQIHQRKITKSEVSISAPLSIFQVRKELSMCYDNFTQYMVEVQVCDSDDAG